MASPTFIGELFVSASALIEHFIFEIYVAFLFLVFVLFFLGGGGPGFQGLFPDRAR